jgi:hypothetical protein
MKKTTRRLIILLFVLLTFSMASGAKATTYSYTGNLFTSGSGDPSLIGSSIHITFHTLIPLTTGFYDLTTNTFSSVAITDGITTYTWTDGVPSPISIANVIASDGVITQWLFYGYNGTIVLYSDIGNGDGAFYINGGPSKGISRPLGTWTSSNPDLGPIVVQGAYQYRDNGGPNTVGNSVGESVKFGAVGVTPDGIQGTTGTATLGGTTVPLSFAPSKTIPGFGVSPNRFHRGKQSGADLNGPSWLLTFVNGPEVNHFSTPDLAGAPQVPLVEDLAMSGNALSPTFTWTIPYPFIPSIAVVGLSDLSSPDSSSAIYGTVLTGSLTSFTVPAVFPGGGSLQPGHSYHFSVHMAVTRSAPATWYEPNLLSVSNTYFNFSVPSQTTAPTLTLTKSGTRAGTITSAPSGINCGNTCTASYDPGTQVTLTATADQGSTFIGWSAPCSGTGTCTVTMAADTQITAAFVSPLYFQTVQKLYLGYYQRPADAAGLLFWANALAQIDGTHTGIFSGDAILPILRDFAFSDEARSLYGGDITSANISTVITSIYWGLFNRDPDPGGLAFYINGFNSGGETPATILWSVMNGAQNSDSLSIANKVAAAMSFTRVIDPDLDGQNFQVTYAGNADAQKARAFLGVVTEDVATIPALAQVTTWMKTNIADPGDPILNQ